VGEQNVWATGGVKIMMDIPYKKDKALCSPTSAFKFKLERKGTARNAERGAEKSFPTNGDKLIVE
jgi:hypothetical protein